MAELLSPIPPLVEAEAFLEAADQLEIFRCDWDGNPLAQEDLAVLRELLFHPNDRLRQQAILVVGCLRDFDSVGLLCQLYAKGLDFYDADYIFDAFHQMGGPAVPRLAEVTSRGAGEESYAAWYGLGLIGGKAIPIIRWGIEDGVRDAVIAAASTRSPRLVSSLLKIIKEKDGELVDLAVSTLSSCIDKTCGEYLDELTALVRGASNSTEREGLTEALASLRDEAVLPTLFWVYDRGGAAAGAALEGLSRIGTRAAVDGLLERLKSNPRLSRRLRGETLAALLEIPSASKEEQVWAARCALEAFDSSGNFDEVLEVAARSRSCRSLFEEVETSQDPLRRVAAGVAFLHSEPGRARAHLEFAWSHGEAEVRVRCAEFGFDIDARFAELVSSDSDERVRKALAGSLPYFSPPADSLPVVETLLSDPRASVRREIALRLGGFRDDSFRLFQRLAGDPSRRVREAAVSTLVSLPLESEARVQCLLAFLWDSKGRPVDPSVGESEGGEEPTKLSTWLSRYDDDHVRNELARWRAAGTSQVKSRAGDLES